MKIINITFSKVMGGMERVFIDYTHVLSSLGHEVISVVHPRGRAKHYLRKGRIVEIRTWNRHDPWACWRLRRLILKEKPDCILMHNHRTVHVCRKTKTKVPKVVVSHVMHGLDYQADAFIAVSQAMRQKMIDFGHPKAQVFYVPNMIQLNPKPASSPSRSPQQRGLTIGVCGRLARDKGLNYLVDALAELKQEQRDFHVLIAGDGKKKAELIQQIQAYGLQDQVELLGWVDDQEAFYQQLDIFCHPSEDEAFGLVILEAMNHHLPIVVTRCPGPLEVIGSPEGAVFVPIADASSLAQGLRSLLDDAALRKKLAHYGQHRVQDYSVEQGGACLEHALNTIITQWRKHETVI